VLLLASWAPPLRGVLDFEIAPVLSLQALALAVACAIAWVDQRALLAPLVRGLGVLVIAFAFQLFVSSLVVFAEPPGKFALASLPLVACWFHGLYVRATPRRPHVVAAHAAGMLAALALRPSPSSALALGLAFPLAAAGALLLGSLAEAEALRRRQLAHHRAAIEAQVLEAQASERDRIADTVAVLAEYQADARRLLAAAKADVERVESGLAALPETTRPAGADALVRGLRGSLARLERAVAEAGPTAPGVTGAEPLAAVDAQAVAADVVADAARRFPAVALAAPPAAAPGATVLVRGGRETLRLILQHLVTNACEGDGASSARSVEVALVTDGTPFAELVVTDDGPGLAADVLNAPLRPFVTTKPGGTGLGLYTAARLAAASGGELVRGNAAGSGAQLRLRLPRAGAEPT
jgi:signal transduction histidine kinase